MKQLTETFHHLEIQRHPNLIWEKVQGGGFLRPAFLHAHHGRLTEAIESAETAWIEHHGSMHLVSFRCVTKSQTITVNAGPIE